MRKVSQLRSYQGKAIEFLLSHPQAGLFLDMGLGKTASALTTVMELSRFGVGPTLVIGPIRVIETVWRQEARIWEHLKHLTFSLVRGNKAERELALSKKANIYLINPEHLEWLLESLPEEGAYPFETLIIDESSMFKNVGTKRFRLLRHKVKRFSRRYIMTGTPTPNNLLNLWSQVFILDQGKRLGATFGRYKVKYFHQVDRWGYKWEPKPGAKEAIYKAISDIVLRMDAKDYLDRAEPIFNQVRITLPKAAREIYRAVEEEALAKISQTVTITAANAAAAMMKCRQIANGVVYTNDGDSIEFLHSEKLEATKEIIEETGSPVIVVYNFKHELALLQKTLKEYDPVTLTESPNASKVVKDWNAGKIQVLLLHPASGGHGLNLQAGGHTMIWFGLTFSYEQYAQTIARIDRQGQENPVIIHTLIAENTVDELLADVLEAKAQGQAELFKYLKAYANHNRGNRK